MTVAQVAILQVLRELRAKPKLTERERVWREIFAAREQVYKVEAK
jgi:hypothetical protein